MGIKWRERRLAWVASTCFVVGMLLGGGVMRGSVEVLCEKEAKKEARLEDVVTEEPKAFFLPPKSWWLPSEREYRKTLRSCLGTACLTFSPSTRPRVALVAVPHPTAEALFSVVAGRIGTSAEVLRHSHAPPYGYGKNHGLTRIVRLAPPLRTENSTALLRQAVRWHCRVSHVAAHTAVLTVDVFGDEPPRPVLERILSFAGVKVDAATLDATEYDYESKVAPLVDAARAALNPDVDGLDAALRAELAATHGLRDWPCPTLWVDDGVGGIPANVRRRAPLLAPNCSAPFVTCGVPRDRCEQTGDCDKSRKKPSAHTHPG